MKIKNKTLKVEWLIVILLLIVSIFMRFYHLGYRAGFAWDEETIAWKVKTILVDKKPTLIGMKAGEYGIFTGPALIYILSLIYFIFAMNPLGVAVTSAVLGVISTLCIYFLGKKIFPPAVALFSAFIYSGSYYLSNYDRTWLLLTFNLTSILIFYFTVKILQTNKKIYLYLVFLLIGFAFNVHITAWFFIPILVMVFLCFRPKYSFKNYLLAFFLFLIWQLPLLVFDLRHNFLNTQGIIKLFSQPGAGQNIWSKLEKISQIVIHNIAGIIYSPVPWWLVWLTLLAILFLVYRIIKDKNRDKNLYLVLFWIIVPALLFVFYSGNIPDYYFNISYVAYVFLWGLILVNFQKIIGIGVWILLAIFLVANIVARIEEPADPFGLTAKRKVVQYIINDAGGKKVDVSYFTPLGLDTGFAYLFWFEGVQLSPEAKKYTIIIPSDFIKEKNTVLGKIAIYFNKIAGSRQMEFGKI